MSDQSPNEIEDLKKRIAFLESKLKQEQKVTVSRVEIGLWNALVIVVTFAIASIPALILISIFFGSLSLFGLAGLSALGKH